MPAPTKAVDFDGDLANFLTGYRYQPRLTKKLDDLANESLTPELVNQIVLWKINRYVELEAEQLKRIDVVRELKPGHHRHARQILEELLGVHGVDLPMASTILRFRNPSVFQIIDRHAYRALNGTKYRLHPTTPTKKKIEVYFAYLDNLGALCVQKGIRFETVDRVLYEFDKKINGDLSNGGAVE